MTEPRTVAGLLPLGPIIVIHLEDPSGSGLTACSGRLFTPTNGWSSIPRWLCTGCSQSAGGTDATAEQAALVATLQEAADDVIATVSEDASYIPHAPRHFDAVARLAAVRAATVDAAQAHDEAIRRAERERIRAEVLGRPVLGQTALFTRNAVLALLDEPQP